MQRRATSNWTGCCKLTSLPVAGYAAFFTTQLQWSADN
jgi:hypothetical protein